MTFLGTLAALFPSFHMVLLATCAVAMFFYPGIISVGAFVFCLYLFPPLLFRLYCLKYPIKSGRSILNHRVRCDWWIAHQLQAVYAAVPTLEALLRLVPGVYSSWLRLWGSKIGKRVYWTPRVEILDRHMLRIGDDVVFGHQVTCSSHIITKKSGGDLVLVTRPTCIGSGTLLGARSRLGPGVRVPAGTSVPYNAEHRLSYGE